MVNGVVHLFGLDDPELEAGFKVVFIPGFSDEEVHFSDLGGLNLIFGGIRPQFCQDQFYIDLTATADENDTD